jgi:OOP family OmpA-OmpF porin
MLTSFSVRGNMAVMRYTAMIVICLVGLAAVAVSQPARASSTEKWLVPRFGEPPVTVDGFHILEGTRVTPTWAWHARISLQYLAGLALAERARQVRGNLVLGLGLPANLEVAVSLPVGVTFNAREDIKGPNNEKRYIGLGEQGTSAGDFSGTVMWSVFDAKDGGFGLLFALRGSAPTGDHQKLMGEGGYTVEPFTALAFQLFGTRLSLNLGYRFREEREMILDGVRYEQDDELIWRFGVRMPRKYDVAWSVEAEGAIGMATYEGAWPSHRSRPVWLCAGVDFPIERQYRLGLFTGVGVVGASVPSLSFGISFNWLPVAADEDDDGIVGSNDQCPVLKEDMDGFIDEDGCPDLDNDMDGFPDDEDRCPLDAGDDFSDDGC